MSFEVSFEVVFQLSSGVPLVGSLAGGVPAGGLLAGGSPAEGSLAAALAGLVGVSSEISFDVSSDVSSEVSFVISFEPAFEEPLDCSQTVRYLRFCRSSISETLRVIPSLLGTSSQRCRSLFTTTPLGGNANFMNSTNHLILSGATPFSESTSVFSVPSSASPTFSSSGALLPHVDRIRPTSTIVLIYLTVDLS
jgi:hypothetical protein